MGGKLWHFFKFGFVDYDSITREVLFLVFLLLPISELYSLYYLVWIYSGVHPINSNTQLLLPSCLTIALNFCIYLIPKTILLLTGGMTPFLFLVSHDFWSGIWVLTCISQLQTNFAGTVIHLFLSFSPFPLTVLVFNYCQNFLFFCCLHLLWCRINNIK